ncbi:hypothetical protein JI664_17675 [Rhodobacter sp. NTK016B]|uniref:hypothetical protein n=1 Tax=Rhodobacter sp. NTK016B TaxID=2759676 RepID=UPI001A8DD0AB|nr:hypothetical protein [Rhodobacter sp. NTK016B]MBN8293805.1 hypothetical protein [Rhodobacter sp. NTK016B]
MILGHAPQQQHQGVEPIDHPLAAFRSVLIVDASEAMRFLDARPHRQSVVLTQKRLLSRAMLASVQPDAIIAPLIAPDWDVVDLGLTLEEMGYRGHLFALSRRLPHAELVIREFAAICPQLAVELLNNPQD